MTNQSSPHAVNWPKGPASKDDSGVRHLLMQVADLALLKRLAPADVLAGLQQNPRS